MDARELDAAGAHVVDVGLRGSVAIFERALFFRLAPEDFVVAVGVERQFGFAHWRRVDVDQVNAATPVAFPEA